MELFKTERTIIQSFNSEYINDFMTYHNNDEWMQFQGFKNLTRAEYETELLKDFSLEEGSQLAIIKKDINLLVGDIFLKEVTNSLFVGYTISPKFSKQGYATEVLLGIIDWAKQKTFSDISAYVEIENLASINLLKKTGFSEVPDSEEEGEILFKFYL
ncbi:GNAT family N-acetyltransferase [Vagococcus fluvialis]|uniref:GNAT family N-acetyltransferase n=1 Tax=Vagococcus fluvialis TaxID=2738 RepID=UPI003B5A4E20